MTQDMRQTVAVRFCFSSFGRTFQRMLAAGVTTLLVAVGLALPGPSARSVAAVEPAVEKPAALEEGFRALFDGKSLNGWHPNPEKIGHGTGASWIVEDAAIVGEQNPPGSGNGGILLTDEQFGDFEVIFEANPDWGPDSGFFLRCTPKGQCYQVMMDYHDGGNVGEIYREGLDGQGNRTFDLNGEYGDSKKLLSIKATKSSKAAGDPKIDIAKWSTLFKHGEWNTIKVRCVNNPPTIDTWINGTHVTTYTSDKDFAGTLSNRGHIALQVHGGVGAWPAGSRVRYRNIRVKDLDEKILGKRASN